MKKLFLYVFLGLLLASCSEMNHEKKTKMIEKCADIVFVENHYKLDQDYTLTEKLTDDDYTEVFLWCENYLKKNPITFKEKYIR